MNKLIIAIAAFFLGLTLSPRGGLVARYEFTGGSLADTSGNGHDAYVSEGAFPGSGATFNTGATSDGSKGDVFDLSGGGVGGDGSNGGLNLTLPVGGNPSGAWTLAMSMKTPTVAYLFDNRNTAAGTTSAGDRLILNLGQSSQPPLSLFDGVSWRSPGAAPVADNSWHHIA